MLSGTRSATSPRQAIAREASRVELKALRVIAQQVTIPMDQLARFLRLSVADTEGLVSSLWLTGWVLSERMVGQKDWWVSLRRGGAVKAGLGLRGRRPSPASLPHHRAINEARLQLEVEYPNGRWMCERELWLLAGRTANVPDGMLLVNEKRYAVEVEISRKTARRTRETIERRLKKYDGVIYFCGARSMSMVKDIQAELGSVSLVVRAVPGDPEEPDRRLRRGVPSPLTADEFNADELRALALISEEGIVPVRLLGDLVGIASKSGAELADRLQGAGALRREYEVGDDGGWVWCTGGGTRVAGTGLTAFQPTSFGALQSHLDILLARLELAKRFPAVTWVSRRRLVQGSESPRRSDVPRAIAKVGRKRLAVCVAVGGRQLPTEFAHLGDWAHEYDAVWCFATPDHLAKLGKLVDAGGWSNVELQRSPEVRSM